jgi:hypothetical protein
MVRSGTILGFHNTDNVESSTILMNLIDKNFLKLSKICPSCLSRLKNYVRSTMKNDRLSSHELVHIHRDFEVDLYKAVGVFVSAKTRRAYFGQC